MTKIQQKFKETYDIITSARQASIGQLEQQIVTLQKSLSKIKYELQLDPEVMRLDLQHKQNSLEEAIVELQQERDRLSAILEQQEHILIQELASNSTNLASASVDEEYLSVAISQYISGATCERYRKQRDKQAAELKKPQLTLNIRSQIRQKDVDKADIAKKIQSLNDDRQHDEKCLSSSLEEKKDSELKLAEAKILLETTNNELDLSKSDVVAKEKQLILAQADFANFNAEDKRKRSELTSKRNAIRPELTAKCQKKISDLTLECEKIIADRHHRLQRLDYLEKKCLIRFDWWWGFHHHGLHSVSSWGRTYHYNTSFSREEFDEFWILHDKFIAENGPNIHDYHVKIDNIRVEYNKKKAALPAQYEQEISQQECEIDRKFEALRASYDDTRREKIKAIDILKEAITTAGKLVDQKDADYQKAIKQQTYCSKQLQFAITKSAEAKAKLEKTINKISVWQAAMLKIEQRIAELSCELEHGTQEEVFVEEQTEIDLQKINAEIIELKLKIERIENELAVKTLEKNTIQYDLDGLAKYTEERKQQLQTELDSLQDKLRITTIDFNAIKEEYAELMDAALLPQGIALSGFKSNKEFGAIKQLIACILQPVLRKYFRYDINNLANSDIPPQFEYYVNIIADKLDATQITVEVLDLIVAKINEEFASDNLRLQVACINSDGSILTSAEMSNAMQIVVWQDMEEHFTLLASANDALPKVYDQVHKLLAGYGFASTQNDLCKYLLEYHCKAEFSKITIEDLSTYYTNLADSLANITTINELCAMVLAGAKDLPDLKANIACESLKVAAKLERDLPVDVKLQSLISNSVNSYLESLLHFINKEIQRRSKDNVVLHSDRLQQIEAMLESNDQEIEKFETTIDQQNEKIRLLEVKISERKAQLDLLRVAYEEQKRKVESELEQNKIQQNICKSELSKFEEDVTNKKTEIETLAKTSASLTRDAAALESALREIENSWTAAKDEVLALEKTLIQENSNLSQIYRERDRAVEIKKDAQEEIERFELFLAFAEKLHVAFKDDRELFKKRKESRKVIAELSANSDMSTAEQATQLYNTMLKFDEIKKLVSPEDDAKLRAILVKLDDVEMLEQFYRIVSELIGVPVIKWELTERKIVVSGYNLSWQDVYENIEQQLKAKLANCGLGFKNGKLVLENVNYFGSISTLPDGLRKLINTHIDVKYPRHTHSAHKASYGQQSVAVIDGLHLDIKDVLKAYTDYIEVIAGNNIEADQDVDLPGISISWLARKDIYCKDNLVINTSGRNAAHYVEKQAPAHNNTTPDGRPGDDGLDGLAGQSAGHVFIKAEKKLVNFSKIRCQANGGDGAPGQQGGDGEKGRKGLGTPDAEADDTTGFGRAQWRLAIARIPGVGLNGEPVPLEKSGNGGTAGKGGWGGEGGFSGDIFISDDENQISKNDSEDLVLVGDEAQKITKQQIEASASSFVAKPAGHGKGGDAGEPGDVGLSCVIIKESFWKKTRKPKYAYFDESGFDGYKEKLNRGWGHDIFGCRAFIDGYCSKFSAQYRLYGDWFDPRELGTQRRQSTDTRSRGKQGEKDESKTKDRSYQKKAVANKNYTKDALYLSNMRQTAIVLSETKEWDGCQVRCAQYIRENQEKLNAAEARLTACKHAEAQTLIAINNAKTNLASSQNREQKLSAEHAEVKAKLTSVEGQIAAADARELELRQQLSQAQSQAIEARANLACASIDVECKQGLATNLEQSYAALNSAAELQHGVDKDELAKKNIVLEQTKSKLETLQNEQIRLRNERQRIINERAAAERDAQKMLLQKREQKDQKREQIQVQATVDYEEKTSYAPGYIHEMPIEEKSDKADVKYAKDDSFIDIAKKLVKRVIWREKKTENQEMPREVEFVNEVITKQKQDLSLAEQFVQQFAIKHKLTTDSKEYVEFKTVLNNALVARPTQIQQESLFVQLLGVNKLEETMYVLQNTIDYTIKAANDSDILPTIIKLLIKHRLVNDKCVTYDSIIVSITSQISMLLEDSVDRDKKVRIYNVKLRKAIAALVALQADDELSINIINLLREQHQQVHALYAKLLFTNKDNFTKNVKKICEQIKQVYPEKTVDTLAALLLNTIPQNIATQEKYLSLLKSLSAEKFSDYNVVASLVYKLVNVTDFTYEEIISFAKLVSNDEPKIEKEILDDIQSRFIEYGNTRLEEIVKQDNKNAEILQIADYYSKSIGIIYSHESCLNDHIRFKILSDKLIRSLRNYELQVTLSSVQKIYHEIVSENLTEFKLACCIDEDIWLEFIKRLPRESSLIDLIPQYILNYNIWLQNSAQIFDLEFCAKLERHLIELKQSVYRMDDKQGQATIVNFISNMENILAARYMQAIEESFAKKYQKLENFDLELKKLDTKVKEFGEFTRVKEDEARKNRQTFIKLLMAKLLSYNKSIDYDTKDELVAAVNEAGLEHVLKLNLFNIEHPEQSIEVNKAKSALQSTIATDPAKIVQVWADLFMLVLTSLKDQKQYNMASSFIKDSEKLFEHLTVEGDENNACVDKCLKEIGRALYNLENIPNSSELQEELGSMCLTLELSAQQRLKYFNSSQAWQVFVKKNLNIEQKQNVLDIKSEILKKLSPCMVAIKLHCSQDVLGADLVKRLISLIDSDKVVELESEITSVHVSLKGTADVVKSLNDLLAKKPGEGTYETTLQQICQKIIDPNESVADEVSQKIILLYDKKIKYSELSSEYLQLIIKLLVSRYQKDLTDFLQKHQKFSSFQQRFADASIVLIDSGATGLLLKLYFDLVVCVRNNRKIKVEELESKVDQIITNICIEKGINISLGYYLIENMTKPLNEVYALISLSSNNVLSVEDTKLITSELAKFGYNQVSNEKINAYLQLSKVILQRQAENCVLSMGDKSHNGQVANRIAAYLNNLILQTIQLLKNQDPNDMLSEDINLNLTYIKSIAKILLVQHKDCELISSFIATIGSVKPLINEAELAYVDYIDHDLVAKPQALPSMWEDLALNKFLKDQNSKYLQSIASYADKKHTFFKEFEKIFCKQKWGKKVGLEEHSALTCAIEKLLASPMGDIPLARKAYNDAKLVLETVQKLDLESSDLQKVKQLSLHLGLALNFKELLITAQIHGAACSESKIFVSIVQHLSTLLDQGIELGSVNLILIALQDCSSMYGIYKIMLETKPGMIVHKVLLHRLYTILQNSKYTNEEKDKIANAFKTFELQNYNTKLGCKLLDRLAHMLQNTNTKTAHEIEQTLQSIVEMKVHDSEDLVSQLDKQYFIFWKLILKRAKWQLVLVDLGFKKIATTMIDNLIKLEKISSSNLVHKIFVLLEAQEGVEINVADFENFIRNFISGEWELSTEFLDILSKHKFNDWLEKSQDFFIKQKDDQARSTERIVSDMRKETDGINSGVESLLDSLKTKVEDIQDKYEKLFKGKTDSEQKKLILDIVSECKNIGPGMYKDKNSDQVHRLLAAMSAALQLTEKHTMRNTQIVAILSFINGFDTGKGRLANIATGEGKSIITRMLAITRAIHGEKVDVLTSQRMLAERDAEEGKDLFALFDIKVGCNCDEECDANEETRKERYYDCQVVYGDIGSFQRDFLLSDYMNKGIRERVADNLIIDEADSMCIDNAETTLYISHRIEDLAHLKELFVLIWSSVNSPDCSEYSPKNVDKIIKLIQEQCDAGTLKIPADLNEFVKFRVKSWITNAYTAYNMDPGHQYCLPAGDDSKAYIVDPYTGVEQLNTQWSNGLHQFIQLKHNLSFTDESLKAIFISNMNFLRKYVGRIYGMSGTLGSETERDLLASIYDLDFFKLPKFMKEQRKEEDGEVTSNTDDWLAAITADVKEKMTNSRVVSEEERASAKASMDKHDQVIKTLNREIISKGALIKSYKRLIKHLEVELKQIEIKLQKSDLTGEQRSEILTSQKYKKAYEIFLQLKLKSVNAERKKIIVNRDELRDERQNFKDIVEKNTKRAILIIAEDQKAAEIIYNSLEQSKLVDKKLLRKYDSSLGDFTVGTLLPGEVVVATNIAGRGTDFKTSKVLEDNGGLHVVLSYMPPNIRVEIQAFGRTARQGKKGTCKFIVKDKLKARFPISVEFLREERDAKEAQRLADFRQRKKLKIDLEDELFKLFAQLQDQIRNKLKDKLYDEKQVDLQIKSLQNNWSFWLDKLSKKIENVYKDGKEQVISAYNNFSSAMLNALETGKFGLIHETGELLKLGKYYLELEEYAEAEKCYDEIIANDPNFSGFARYYKVLCIFGNEAGFDRKHEARAQLKIAVKLFQESMTRLNNSTQIIKFLSDRAKEQGERGLVDYFTKSNSNEVAFLNIHLQAAKEALGSELMPESFLSGYFTTEDTAMIWRNIRKECAHIIKDYRLSKKVSIANGELLYKGQKVDFPSQLEYCKDEVLTRLSQRLSTDLSTRTLPENLFDDLILTKKEFLETVASKIYEQKVIELVPGAQNSRTGSDLWLDRDEIKHYIFDLTSIVSEEHVAKVFKLTPEEVEKLFSNLVNQNIIKRSTTLIPNSDCEKILEELLKESKEPTNFLQKIGINLNGSKKIHARTYEKTILQLYLCSKQGNDFKLTLADSVEERSKAVWAQFKDLSVIKYPTVNFRMTHDPEKHLEVIKETIKAKFSQIFKEVSKDDREKMEDSLYEAVEKVIGKIKTYEKLKIDSRTLQFYFQGGKIPPELLDYSIRCCEDVLSLKKDSGWWDWDAFIVAVIGLVQVVVGVILTAYGLGFVGQILINEGISDISFAAQAMANGNFSWKAYGEHKWQSLLVSVACAGVGSALSSTTSAGANLGAKFGDELVKQAIIKTIAAKCLDAAITCGISLASAALAKEAAKAIFAEIKKNIKSEIRSSAAFKAAEARLRSKMHKLYSTLSKTDADNAINLAISQMNLEQKIQSQFSTQAMRISGTVAGHLGRLAASDKFSSLDKAKGTNFGSSTLSVIGKISEILSQVLKLANIAKIGVEISSNTATLLSEVEAKLDQAIARTASQQKPHDEFSDESDKQLKCVVDNITDQIQLYFERHLLSAGITQLIELGRAPTVNKIVDKLSEDLNAMQTQVVYEGRLEQSGRGEVELTSEERNILVDATRGLKFAEIYTPSQMQEKDISEKIVTPKGEVDLDTLLEQKGSSGMYVVHRNDKYYLIQPDYQAYLENMNSGKFSGALELQGYAEHTHQNIKVVSPYGGSHNAAPEDGFKPLSRQSDDSITLVLHDKHYNPVIDGKEVDLSNANAIDMPENSCAAQAIVYAKEYKAAVDLGLSAEAAHEAALQHASNPIEVKGFINETVTEMRSSPQMRQFYYDGLQEKYPQLSGGLSNRDFWYASGGLEWQYYEQQLHKLGEQAGQLWDKWQPVTRGLGLAQCVGGITQTVGSVAGGLITSPSGVTPILAGISAAYGIDSSIAGCTSFITGVPHHTMTYNALIDSGVNPNVAMVTDFWFGQGAVLLKARPTLGLYANDLMQNLRYSNFGIYSTMQMRDFRTYTGMRGGNIFINEPSVFHATTSTQSTHGVLSGIDPGHFKNKNRFDKGMYLAENPYTSIPELANKGCQPTESIRYSFNSKHANILDLSQPSIAKEWKYVGGDNYDLTKPIAVDAKSSGYNVIRYPSARVPGENNLVIFSDFDRILTPKMVIPAPNKQLPTEGWVPRPKIRY